MLHLQESLNRPPRGDPGGQPHHAFLLRQNGEPSRTRTCDPLVKSQLLYRLSYRPILDIAERKSVECAPFQLRGILLNQHFNCPKCENCSEKFVANPTRERVKRNLLFRGIEFCSRQTCLPQSQRQLPSETLREFHHSHSHQALAWGTRTAHSF